MICKYAKRIITILLLVFAAAGAVAQDDCGLPEPLRPTGKQRRLMKEALDGQLRDWKAIGATGHQPAIAFETIDDKRIVVSAVYEMDDSAAMKTEEKYDWARAAVLWDVTHRLSDIFDMVRTLGYDVVLKTAFVPGGKQMLFVYDNAALRRIMSLESPSAVRLYGEAVSLRKRAPFEFDDSIVCTGASYCNHLFTVNLRVDYKPDSNEYPMPWLDLQIYCASALEESSTRIVAAIDSTTVRFNVEWPGLCEPMTFDFTPDCLRTDGTLVAVDTIGDMIATNVNSQCPMVLDSIITLQSCEYDPEMKLIVQHLVASEMTVLNIEGREDVARYNILAVMSALPDTREMLDALVQIGLGLEFRMRSRTSFRPATITYTPDELRAFLAE